MYIEVVGGDDDDSVEAAEDVCKHAVLTPLPLDKLTMHSAAACAIQKKSLARTEIL